MRKSEKIILAVLALDVLAMGSFIGWKYYARSHNNISPVVSSQSDASPGAQLQSGLDVSVKPFYDIGAGKKSNAKVPLSQKAQNTNNNAAETNVANTNSGIKPLITEDTNTNAGFAPAGLDNSKPDANNTEPNNSNGAFSFAVIGDTQQFDVNSADDSFKQAVASINKSNPDLVMTVGDLISSCDGTEKCKSKYEDWKKIISPLYSKTKEVVGNHDRTGKSASDTVWQDEFDLPTNGPSGYSESVYSFDNGNTHFVVLNSEKPEEHIINKDQRDWLEQDLSQNTKDNTFVFFHEPAYPVSSKIDESLDVKKSDRDALWSILKNHKVTAVFSGHEHIMSRRKVDGLYQFVVGNTDMSDHDAPKEGLTEYYYQGHHYAIVSVKGKEITVNIYKVDGSLLNSFVIPK